MMDEILKDKGLFGVHSHSHNQIPLAKIAKRIKPILFFFNLQFDTA